MSSNLNSTQWRKITVFVEKNRNAIEQLKSHEQLNEFIRGDVEEGLLSEFKPLLGENQRWCDIGDVYQICQNKGVKCPVPPIDKLPLTIEQLRHNVRVRLSATGEMGIKP